MVKTKYTAGPHTPPLAHVDIHSVIIPIPCQKISVRTNSCPKRMRGGGGGGVKKEYCLAGEYSGFLLIRFCNKSEELKIFLGPSFLHTFCSPLKFAGCKIFHGKPKFLPPIGFQKRWPCSLHSFGLTDMQVMTLSKSIFRKNCQNLILTSEILDQSFSFFSLCVSSPLSPATLGTGLSACRPSHSPVLSLRK